MRRLRERLAEWFGRQSVFKILVITTLFSTASLSFLLILSFQRIADEHPRRFLARALLQEISQRSLDPMQQGPQTVGGIPLIHMTAEQALASDYARLFRAAQADRDGIAVMRVGDHFAAGDYRGEFFTVLPEFGTSISAYALFLLGLVVAAVIAVIAGIFYLMGRVTRPFDVLAQGIARIEDGDLNYQIPLSETFGEFRIFASAFNKMVAELQRIHEARRHMLLALPHELLTPLSRLKVRKELVDDEDLRARIGKDITVVEELLSSILAAERRHSNEDATELVEILPYAQEQVAQQVDDSYPLSIHNRTGHEAVFFDPFLVSVLLKNFVSNAVRYGNGRPIQVTFDRDATDVRSLRIAVQDQGIGIARDQIPFLVEPFWRVDESRGRASGGYGLGLYLCRTIVDGLGGRIEIESELGQGTVISVLIPNAIYDEIEFLDH